MNILLVTCTGPDAGAAFVVVVGVVATVVVMSGVVAVVAVVLFTGNVGLAGSVLARGLVSLCVGSESVPMNFGCCCCCCGCCGCERRVKISESILSLEGVLSRGF